MSYVALVACPEGQRQDAARALAAELRLAVERVSLLHRGANELGLYAEARILWKMGADLSELAARVQP